MTVFLGQPFARTLIVVTRHFKDKDCIHNWALLINLSMFETSSSQSQAVVIILS
jgi:hypothetical protein